MIFSFVGHKISHTTAQLCHGRVIEQIRLSQQNSISDSRIRISYHFPMRWNSFDFFPNHLKMEKQFLVRGLDLVCVPYFALGHA
jgi:hypothetical protein